MSDNIIEEYSGPYRIIEEYSGPTTIVPKGHKENVSCIKDANVFECFDCSDLEPTEIMIRYIEVNPLESQMVNNYNNYSVGLRMLCYCDGLIIEKGKSLYVKKNNIEVKISNFYIKPVKIENIFHAECTEKEKYIVCHIICDFIDDNNAIRFTFEEYKRAFNIIIKKYPELYLTKDSYSNDIERYLSEKYIENKQYLEYVNVVCFSGWTNLLAPRAVYANSNIVGCTCNKELSLIDNEDRFSIFNNGINILNVSYDLEKSLVPFLYAHTGFMAKLFEDAGHPIRFGLFIKGKSGSYKTTLAKVLFNVFQTDQSKKVINFESTKAAVEMALKESKDDILIMDDINFSLKGTQKKANELFELAIRSIGDSNTKAKVSLDQKSIAQNLVRCGLVLTGEDEPENSLSSSLRYLTLNVDNTSYRSDILFYFSDNEDVMKKYFTSFIFFLTENYDEIVFYIKNNFRVLCERYGKTSLYDRLNFSVISLMLVADVIKEYAKWSNIKDLSVFDQSLNLTEDVLKENVRRKSNESKCLELEELVLIALNQTLDIQANCRLAKDIKDYEKDVNSYIGFKKNDEIWLRHEDLFEVVCKYWDKQGKAYTATQDKTHKRLYEVGVIKCYDDIDKNGYLMKSSSINGRRIRMIVIKNEKLNTIN